MILFFRYKDAKTHGTATVSGGTISGNRASENSGIRGNVLVSGGECLNL